MKIKKARKIWNMLLRNKKLNWSDYTIRTACNMAYTHFIKAKVAGCQFTSMEEWVFRKHLWTQYK